jgi:hypothetical protein
MYVKPSKIKPEHRELLKKIKPYLFALQLGFLKILGLFFKGPYGKFVKRDPDFSLLDGKVFFIISLARSGTTALW